MAATPPPVSPAPRPVAPKPRRNHLQISPNLEALLQHDELTRRTSRSPTSAYYSSPSPEFPISLPPPPPRNGNLKSCRRAGQDPFPTARSKTAWPGPSTAGQSASGSSSRPVTPNPYLNPTPILDPINTPDLDDPLTPKQSDTFLPIDHPPPETRGRQPTSERPSNALHKVEKILWMGRDFNLFSGSATAMKRESDRRNDRIESGVQDRQMWQPPVPPRLGSRFGDSDTATISLASKSAASYPQAQRPHVEPLHPTHSEPSLVREKTPISLRSPAQRLPCLSLPSTFMPHSTPSQPQSVDDVAGNDYLSFIDFFSPSTSDELNISHVQDSPRKVSPRHQLQSISIPPSGPYSISHNNHSSTSLASMRFAPPSPTTVHQPSPSDTSSAMSSPSVALSAIVFAPPSPSTELLPARLQPFSDPPSPYSPLEFAPPSSPLLEVINEPSLLTPPEPLAERGRKLRSKKRSQSSSPYHVHSLPPTTNELDANERADRIRRNRKLARVFGRAPGVDELITDGDEPRVSKKSQALASFLTKQKLHRHAVSVSLSLKVPGIKTEPSTPWQTNDLWSPGGRRHSTPLATDITLYMDDKQYRTAPRAPRRSHHRCASPAGDSARSFIDLSDEEARDDDVSELSCFTVHQSKRRAIRHSNSTPSLISLDAEAQAELERQRKRKQLAKLHRCLGSRVPPEAVIGCIAGPPLPPPASIEEPIPERPRSGHKGGRSDEFDRGKEELDEREKALNVRRAQKMERVFGTPPPQGLYHTRPTRSTPPVSPNNAPYMLSLDPPSSSRNPNQSAYTGKTPQQPGPSDSTRCLLPRQSDPQSSPSSIAQSFADSLSDSSGYQQVLAQSSVYLNYQHSLNSLVDIIDRDDRQSLIELYRFFIGEAGESSDEEVVMLPRRPSNATSLRSERRHSLPSSASMTSLSSEFYVSPQTRRFQIRRRKAAKLTNFFGVDYRELIHHILESIEKGVEEEHIMGNLQPVEVEVLMHRVRSLRTLRNPFAS